MHLVALLDSLMESDGVTVRVNVRVRDCVFVFVADVDADADGPDELDVDAVDEPLAVRVTDVVTVTDPVGVTDVDASANTTTNQVHARAGHCTCILILVTTACAKRTGAAASVEHRRLEPARAISPE